MERYTLQMDLILYNNEPIFGNKNRKRILHVRFLARLEDGGVKQASDSMIVIYFQELA